MTGKQQLQAGGCPAASATYQAANYPMSVGTLYTLMQKKRHLGSAPQLIGAWPCATRGEVSGTVGVRDQALQTTGALDSEPATGGERGGSTGGPAKGQSGPVLALYWRLSVTAGLQAHHFGAIAQASDPAFWWHAPQGHNWGRGCCLGATLECCCRQPQSPCIHS